MERYVLLLGWLALGGACASLSVPSKPLPVGVAGVPVEKLMEVCWPSDAPSKAKIRLSFDRSGGLVKSVFAESLDGASNAIAKCVREVAVAYPWSFGEAPPRLEVSPPARSPSGWLIMAYQQLMNAGAQAVRGGVEHSASLVAACLSREPLRPHVRFVYRSKMARAVAVSLQGEQWGELVDLTPAERCVVSVLGATHFSNGTWMLDFHDTQYKPQAASLDEVRWYFPKQNRPDARPLEVFELEKGFSQAKEAVSACWEDTLRRRLGLEGGRSFRILILPSGQVEHAQVIANESETPLNANDFLLDQCVVGALSKLTFSNPKNTWAAASYSWVFVPRSVTDERRR